MCIIYCNDYNKIYSKKNILLITNIHYGRIGRHLLMVNIKFTCLACI